MNRHKIYLVLFTISVFLFYSCKDDAPTNPCANAHAVSASFLIEETWTSTDYAAPAWVYYDTDTVCTYRIKLTANELGATSYHWHVGSDTTDYTNQSFTLTFPFQFIRGQSPQNIPVTLIVNKTPDKKCFPGDNGIDTFTRIIHFVTDTGGSLIKGHFFGYWDGNPNDTGTIYITQHDAIHPRDGMYAYGLTPAYGRIDRHYGDYQYGNEIGRGYREVQCSINNGQYGGFIIILNQDNTVNITAYDHNRPLVHHYTGKKISED